MIAAARSTSALVAMYSPMIIVISVMFWGFVANAPMKSFVYLTLVSIITATRSWMAPSDEEAAAAAAAAKPISGGAATATAASPPKASLAPPAQASSASLAPPAQTTPPPVVFDPAVCAQGVRIPNDPAYSAVVSAFTLMYLLAPMLMNGSGGVNFGAIGCTAAMMLFDAAVRIRLKCVSAAQMTAAAAGGGLMGAGLGLLFYACARSFVFVNIYSSNYEICSVPSKQQFKCRLYKNGELVTK